MDVLQQPLGQVTKFVWEACVFGLSPKFRSCQFRKQGSRPPGRLFSHKVLDYLEPAICVLLEDL
jgi:hypothetical protein